MPVDIKSERTAIRRNKPSRPCRDLYEKTLYLPEGCSVLDYGCGRGDDVAFLREHGYKVEGYDPHYYPDTNLDIKTKYELVMCNYVLCVLPNFTDREDAIYRMWNRVAPEGCMSISVRSKKEIDVARKNKNWISHRDGWITNHNTFQKGFTEDDLTKLVMNLPNAAYIETTNGNKDVVTVRVLKRKTPLPENDTLSWQSQ